MGEHEVHLSTVQPLRQPRQLAGAGDVELVRAIQVDRDRAYAVRRVLDRIFGPVPNRLRVGVEELGMGADDEDTWDRNRRVRVAL